MLSPQCPTNLLGRDLITQLKLAIVPTVKGGLKVQRINETLVIEAEDSPITYWSLDVIPIAGPQDFTKYVVERAKNLIPPEAEWQKKENLHVTMCFGQSCTNTLQRKLSSLPAHVTAVAHTMYIQGHPHV